MLIGFWKAEILNAANQLLLEQAASSSPVFGIAELLIRLQILQRTKTCSQGVAGLHGENGMGEGKLSPT